MRKIIIIISAIMLATPIVARAMDDLMPASSEDLEQFDKAMAVHQQQQEQRSQKKEKRENKERQPKKDSFGQRVSTEAMRMRDSNSDKNGETANRWGSGRRQGDRDANRAASPANRDRGDRGGESGRSGRRGGGN